jgi:hypothetical protein
MRTLWRCMPHWPWCSFIYFRQKYTVANFINITDMTMHRGTNVLFCFVKYALGRKLFQVKVCRSSIFLFGTRLLRWIAFSLKMQPIITAELCVKYGLYCTDRHQNRICLIIPNLIKISWIVLETKHEGGQIPPPHSTFMLCQERTEMV